MVLYKRHLFFIRFPRNLINLIMSCISTSSIEILINGRKTNSFLPTRGIRQGDPMSPYLFILCMERLSREIDNQGLLGNCKPIKISRKGPKLSQLFFVDDLTLFASADQDNCETINSTLQSFHKASRQKVNLIKCKAIFSKNCLDNIRHLYTNIL